MSGTLDRQHLLDCLPGDPELSGDFSLGQPVIDEQLHEIAPLDGQPLGLPGVLEGLLAHLLDLPEGRVAPSLMLGHRASVTTHGCHDNVELSREAAEFDGSLASGGLISSANNNQDAVLGVRFGHRSRVVTVFAGSPTVARPPPSPGAVSALDAHRRMLTPGVASGNQPTEGCAVGSVAREQIVVDQVGRVGVITLNRPERLNAWSQAMENEMRAAVTEFDTDPEVGAIVFTGAGRAYCAGADISTFTGQFDSGPPQRDHSRTLWTRFLLDLGTPTICAVNGTAVGMGVSTMLPMDIRIASTEAKFGLFFVKMGVVPELGSSYYLAQLVGLGRALEWCLTARLVPAQEAKEAGLVTEVVVPDELLPRALELGAAVANQPSPSVRLTRGLFRDNASCDDIDAVMDRELTVLDEAFVTWEHREAVTAFVEKRQADFTRRPIA